MTRVRVHRGAAAGCAGGALILAGLAGAHSAGLRINNTVSMPRGLWRVAAATNPLRRGEVVAFCPPDTPPFQQAEARGYIASGSCPGGHAPLLKPVAATPGDTVAVTASGLIAVNGELVRGSAQLAQDSAGRPLQPVQPGTYPVTNGQVWLLSGHDPRSFDSRYYGPVPANAVQGVARPVWVLP